MVCDLTIEDFDELLGEAVDDLPRWVLEALGECVVRVEMRRRLISVTTANRLTIYREPTLSLAQSHTELRRLVRTELVRALVAHLDLDGTRAAEVAATYF